MSIVHIKFFFSLKLLKKAKFQATEKGCLLSDVHLFLNSMHDYNIMVYSKKEGMKPLITGPLGSRKDINIFYLEDLKHFITIKQIKVFFNTVYQCEHCCSFQCSFCLSFPPCSSVAKMISCDNCCHSFYGKSCFINHKNNS